GDPVVVGLAQAEGEPRIEVVPSDETEAGGGEEHGDVHALHLHAHHLCHRVVAALDGEVEPPRVGQPRARQGLRAVGVRGARPRALAVLLQLGVLGGRQAVDDDGAPTRAAVLADGKDDALFESRVEVAPEQVGRFHDVHVAIHEPESVFHDALRVMGNAWNLDWPDMAAYAGPARLYRRAQLSQRIFALDLSLTPSRCVNSSMAVGKSP